MTGKPGDNRRSEHWPDTRAAHLADEPACMVCGGTLRLEVHHIAPFHVRPDLELAPDNLITLCEHPGHDCHYVFGHYHDWRAWNVFVRTDAAAYLAHQREAHSRVG